MSVLSFLDEKIEQLKTGYNKLDQKLAGKIGEATDSHFDKKEKERMDRFLNASRAISEIHSDDFDYDIGNGQASVSYLNGENVRLSCVTKDGEKTFDLTKDEHVYAVWKCNSAIDSDKLDIELDIKDEKGFEYGIRSMLPAVDHLLKSYKETNKNNEDTSLKKSNKIKPM